MLKSFIDEKIIDLTKLLTKSECIPRYKRLAQTQMQNVKHIEIDIGKFILIKNKNEKIKNNKISKINQFLNVFVNNLI